MRNDTKNKTNRQTPANPQSTCGTCKDCFFWINRVPDNVIGGYAGTGYCIGMSFDTEKDDNAIIVQDGERYSLDPEREYNQEEFKFVTGEDFGCIRFQDKQWTLGAATQPTELISANK